MKGGLCWAEVENRIKREKNIKISVTYEYSGIMDPTETYDVQTQNMKKRQKGVIRGEK